MLFLYPRPERAGFYEGLDNANLEELAEACRQHNRWEFLMCVGPLRLFNSTGSPLNPIAVF